MEDRHVEKETDGHTQRAANGAPGDWDWLVGSWNVRHRKLKERLVGCGEWITFEGTCTNWPLLDGHGNVDDNVFNTPDGAYRGVGLRALDAATGLQLPAW